MLQPLPGRSASRTATAHHQVPISPRARSTDWTGLFQFGAKCSRDCVARLRSDLLRCTRPWPAGAALGVREREEKRTERTLCTRRPDAKVKLLSRNPACHVCTPPRRFLTDVSTVSPSRQPSFHVSFHSFTLASSVPHLGFDVFEGSRPPHLSPPHSTQDRAHSAKDRLLTCTFTRSQHLHAPHLHAARRLLMRERTRTRTSRRSVTAVTIVTFIANLVAARSNAHK